jgi:flagellar motor protein MotB
VTKLANLIAAAVLAVPLMALADQQQQPPAPDLADLQSSLAAERQRIDVLAKVAEQAKAGQQQINALQQENQQLRADLARVHEQLQVAEGRAANAEAERDQMRTGAAKAAEDARQSLVALVGNIKNLNDAVKGPAQPEASPPQVEPPMPILPKPESKPLAHAVKPAPAPAPVTKEEQQRATLEHQHFDQRGVLGGRPSAFSFDDLPEANRKQIKQLLVDLDAKTDERGLVMTVPADSLFVPGSERLRRPVPVQLDEIGQLIKLAGNRDILIVGHTAGSRAATQNQTLSARQAAAVRQYLIERGVRPTRLTAKGVGSSRPIESEATAEGRSVNRRVEVLILN